MPPPRARPGVRITLPGEERADQRMPRYGPGVRMMGQWSREDSAYSSGADSNGPFASSAARGRPQGGGGEEEVAPVRGMDALSNRRRGLARMQGSVAGGQGFLD